MQTFIQSTQTAESIPFTSGSGITATNVQEAIIQASTMGGSGTITTNIDLQNLYKVINSLNPVNPQDLATKYYVDYLISLVSGGGGVTSSNVPTFLMSGLTFTVPENTQLLFTLPIVSEGLIDCSGTLIEMG